MSMAEVTLDREAESSSLESYSFAKSLKLQWNFLIPLLVF